MYIEWFLLDNTLMNYLILRSAGALLSLSPPRRYLWLGSFFCGVLAALALTALPFLLTLPGKLAVAVFMAFPFVKKPAELPRAVAAVAAATLLTGGCLYACTFLLGGNFTSGLLLAAPPLRAVLTGAAVSASFPGWIRSWRLHQAQKKLLYPVRMTHNGAVRTFTAFLDTGNALSDPLSGLPVILVAPGLLPDGPIRPVPCETVAGSCVLPAIRPEKLEICCGGWREFNAFAAASPTKIRNADALIGIGVFSNLPPDGKELTVYEAE